MLCSHVASAPSTTASACDADTAATRAELVIVAHRSPKRSACTVFSPCASSGDAAITHVARRAAEGATKELRQLRLVVGHVAAPLRERGDALAEHQRLELIPIASRAFWPVTLLCLSCSQPARSTSASCDEISRSPASAAPSVSASASSPRWVIVTRKTVCARLEASFIAVAATRLCSSPARSSASASVSERSSTCAAPCRMGPLAAPPSAYSPGSRRLTAPPESRSVSVSS